MSIKSYLLAFGLGAILPCAFAPLNWWPISFISLIGYFWLLHHQQSTWRAFRIGWCYGLGLFGVGVSWVFVSIHVYGETHMLLAGLITTLFISFLACYHALFAWLLVRFIQPNYRVVAFPALWCLSEIFRSWALTGFPWLLLGYTQTSAPLKSLAPVIGVYGLSTIIALIAICVYQLIRSKRRIKLICMAILFSVTILNYSASQQSWTETQDTQSVHLIQGNVKPQEKFMMEQPLIGAWQAYGLLMQSLPPADFIIWPENSITYPLPYAGSFVRSLNEWAIAHNTTLLVNIPEEKPNDPDHFYSSMVMLGKDQGVYYKQKLVPFGEYLPFENYLRGLINFFDIPMSSLESGPKQPAMISRQSKFLPMICWEIAYPNYVRSNLKEQASEVIIMQSEDGWFGRTIGPHQHLQIAQMRALETSRYVVRSTPTGISAIITDEGDVIARTPQFERTVLSSEWQDISGFTPWVTWGYQWLLILCLIILAICIMLTRYTTHPIIFRCFRQSH